MTTVHVMNKSNRSPLAKHAAVSMRTVTVLFGKTGVNVYYPKAGIYGPKPWIRTKVATKRLSGPLIPNQRLPLWRRIAIPVAKMWFVHDV